MKAAATPKPWRGPFAAALVCALLWPGTGAVPAYAQSVTSAPLPQAEVGGGRNDAGPRGDLAVRVDQLEGQVRSLTGQVEQYEFRIRQLEEQLRRFQGDVEFRFRESGGGTGAPAPRAADEGGRIPPQGNFAPPPPPSRGPGQPATFGGIRQLGSEGPTGGVPATSGPMNISPSARNEPPGAVPQPGEPRGSDGGGFGGNPGEVALAVPQDAQTSYDVAYAFILQRDFEAAQSAFADFLRRYPNDKLAGNAQYWLGESHYAQGQYREAADAFLSGYRKYANSGKGPDSLLKLGMSLSALGEKQAACASFNEFGKQFPSASDAMQKRVRAERKDAGC